MDVTELISERGGRLPLPSGTVTFLFTDIEGSTRLLEQLRDDFAILLADQRRLLRAAFQEWNGFEVDTQGDSFFVAFPRAIDALNCAIDAQRALARHEWPSGAQVRVRMALHTGEPLVQRTGYVGMDVHRAARIGGAGHGGQILVSHSTRELVAADLPAGIELVALGPHQLKDVRQPVELYQVHANGLIEQFPELRTLATGDEPPTPGEPPFKGLEYFDESDAHLFFGREQLTSALVERMASTRFLAIVGASGSGKSSVVRAGLVPALRKQDAVQWTIRTLTPSTRPLESLALALTSGASIDKTAGALSALASDERTVHLLAQRMIATKRGRDQRLLLVVDQFEELFTLARDESGCEMFVANIVHALATEGPVSVLITLRADFYSGLAAYDQLRTAVAESQEYIGPMSSSELRRAIEAPAEAGGWQFAPGLVDLILHDVGEEPGALPLLSHALLETWRRRRGNTMTLKAYGESGGVRGAIARTADRVFHAELDSGQRDIARSIFLRLTELGEGAQDTRRRVALRELVTEGKAEVDTRDVLARLVEARLVTTSEETVEVAHEALIREWPTLRDWLSENRDALRIHRHLTDASNEWELLERDPGALYRGARLVNALEWATDHGSMLNDQESAFLDASARQRELDQAEEEARTRRELEAAEQLAATQQAAAGRLRRRAWLLSGALLIAGLMAGAALVLGLSAQQNASAAAENFAEAESQRLAGESSTLLQLQGSSELAAILALRGLGAHYSPQADMALQRVAPLDFGKLRIAHPRQVDDVAIAPDGQTVMTYSRDGTARLWNMSDGQLIRESTIGGFGTVDFHPDGSGVVVCTEEQLVFLDAETGQTRWQLEPGFEARFSSDGSELFISRGDRVDVVAGDTGEPIRTLPIEAEGLTVSPDGAQLMLGDRLVDAQTGEVVHTLVGHANAVNGTAFSPDGELLATSSWDETAKVWDRSTGELLQTMTGHTELLFGISFTPDSSKILTGSLDNTVRLWDVETGEQLRRLTGHTAGVYIAKFTPDGRLAVTGSADGSLRLWDMARPVETDTIDGHDSFVYAVTFSPDGRQIFTGSADGTGALWNADSLTGQHLSYETSRVDRAAFSGDGLYLLLSHEGRAAELRDAATGNLITALEGSPGGITADFSADSSLLLAGADSGSAPEDPPTSAVGLWDVATRTLLRTFTVPGFANGVLSPDAKYVVLVKDDAAPNLIVFDAATGAQLKEMEASPGGISSAVFAPDSRHILTGSRDNIARIINVETGEIRELIGHTNIIWGAAVSPDGRLALTGSQDRSARLWDIATGEEVRRFASHDYSAIAGVAFSPDGQTIAIGNFDGTVQLTPAVLSDLQQDVCARLLRDFLPVEREIYEIPDERATCE